jgi:hypothetical protein
MKRINFNPLIKEIANETGTSRSSVNYWRKKNDLKKVTENE